MLFDGFETYQLRFGFKETRTRLSKGKTVTTGWLQALIPSSLILFVTPVTTSRYLPFDAVHNLTSSAEKAFSGSITPFTTHPSDKHLLGDRIFGGGVAVW